MRRALGGPPAQRIAPRGAQRRKHLKTKPALAAARRIAAARRAASSVRTRPVVLDGLSIGRSGGSGVGAGTAVDMRQITAALRYYLQHGANAVVLLPEDADVSVEGRRALSVLSVYEKVVSTPGGDNYYPFVARAAQLRGADLVTNYRFDVLLAVQRNRRNRLHAARYLQTHVIPFRFVLGSFVPQPDVRAVAFGLHGPRLTPAADAALPAAVPVNVPLRLRKR